MTTTFPKSEKNQTTPADNQKSIENHKKAATHFDNASKSHLEAAKHHENGEHEKAAQSTVNAHGHNVMARKVQKKDAKLQASKN